MKFFRIILFQFLLLAILQGCHPPAENQPGKAIIFTSISPQAFFVEKIADSTVDIQVLVKPGQSPHTFEPTPQQLTLLAKARIFFTIGLPFEKQLVHRIEGMYPNLKIIDTAQGVPKRKLEDHHENHLPAQDSHEDNLDPHIWLSPALIKIQAQHILDGLCQIIPEKKEDFRTNFTDFCKELDQTQADIQTILKPYRGESFYVFHPSFAYFADAFGLHEVAVETEGKSPTPKQMADLIASMKTKGIRILFVQPQFDQKSAETIAEAIGGTVISMDPLERNVLKSMKDAAQKIKSALQPKDTDQ